MSKPIDKLPSLDPNERGIFDRIIVTCAQVRKDRKSDEYRQAEQRREQAAIALRELRERERQETEAELYRQQQIARTVPIFDPFGGKILQESEMPRFVR